MTLDLSGAGPSDTLALEFVLPEILLDVVPGNVQLAIDDPSSRVRIDEVLLNRVVGSVVVATKIYLQCVCSFATKSRRFVLNDEGVDWFR